MDTQDTTTTFAPHTRALSRRITEAGKIRIGCQVPIEHGKNAGKPRPERLKHFRLTSNSRVALDIAAHRYQGTVRPWVIRPEWKESVRPPDHQWELYTESDTLDILVRADGLMDTLYEQWDGPYCTRRCDGQFILHDGYGKLTGLQCQCPLSLEERKTLATQGKACTAVSRLVVMLEGLPLGQWRLDTRGDNTPAEVRGLQDILGLCGVGGAVLRATMRLEFRTSRRMVNGEKQVHHYSCVVIEPRFTPEQLLAEGERQQTRLLAMPDEREKDMATHIADLTGDQDALQSRLAAERQGARPSPADGTAALRAQIDALLTGQGLNDRQRDAYWAQHQGEQSPGSLTYLKEKLEAEARATDAALALGEVGQRINEAHARAGYGAVWIAAYWRKMDKRFHRAATVDFTLEQLQGLEQEVVQFYAKTGTREAQEGVSASQAALQSSRETQGTLGDPGASGEPPADMTTGELLDDLPGSPDTPLSEPPVEEEADLWEQEATAEREGRA